MPKVTFPPIAARHCLRTAGEHSYGVVVFTVYKNEVLIDDLAGAPFIESKEAARNRWANMVRRGWFREDTAAAAKMNTTAPGRSW